MNSYIKQKILAVVCLIFIFVSGCSQKDEKVSLPKNTSNTDEIIKISEKIKNLDKISNINDVVIIVNGFPITRKDFETQKIYQRDAQNKNIIDSLIRTKAIKSEAIRLNIQPSKEKINAYLTQIRESISNKEEGSETITTYIKTLGLSIEEYLELLEESTYDMYQREALWEYVSEKDNLADYEEYVDNLAKKADIKFVDVQIEKLYRQG